MISLCRRAHYSPAARRGHSPWPGVSVALERDRSGIDLHSFMRKFGLNEGLCA